MEAEKKSDMDMSAAALVDNIQGYSIHDGPGIRTVVFLKGCPLRCRWCANPENLEDRVRVGFLANLCKHCSRCAGACPRGAILPDPERRIDRARCDECGECTEACFYGALVRYGKRMTAEETFRKVRRDKLFYDTSGGGITVSGGEPLLHADFVAELFALCRGEGIGTCAETCGCVPRSTLERMLPLTDLFYFDLKLMDSERHREYTGRGNEAILENMDKCPLILSHQYTLQRTWLKDGEHLYGQFLVTAQGKGSGIHHFKMFLDRLIKSDAGVTGRIGVFHGIGGIDTIHLGRFQHKLRTDLRATQCRRGICCKERIACPSGKDNHLALLKILQRFRPDGRYALQIKPLCRWHTHAVHGLLHTAMHLLAHKTPK